MTSLLDTVHLSDLPAALTPVWRWWTAEIAGLVPAAIRRRYGAPVKASVDIFDDGTVVFRRGKAAHPPVLSGRSPFDGGPNELRETVIACIEPKHVYVTRVTLPAATKKNLAKIVRHELERHSPIDIAKTFFCYRILSSDHARRRQEVELRIVKREIVDLILDIGNNNGLRIGAIRMIGDPDDVPPIVTLAAPTEGLRRWITGCLTLCIVGLGLAIPVVDYVRADQYAAVLQDQIKIERSKAQRVDALKRQLAAVKQRENVLIERREAPFVLSLLAQVTGLLPDNTWIVQFDIAGREVRIRGYSPSASSLIGIFDKSPMFSNARFRAPLTQGSPVGLERFDLSFDVRESKK